MTEQERLKDIKALLVERDKYTNVDGETDYSNYDKYINILNDDGHIDWLVEWIQNLEDQLDFIKKSRDTLRIKSKNYKQALEFYADEDIYTVLDGERIKGIFTDQGEKARQALKGDTNA